MGEKHENKNGVAGVRVIKLGWEAIVAGSCRQAEAKWLSVGLLKKSIKRGDWLDKGFETEWDRNCVE